MSALLVAALAYAARGWGVFPCYEIRNGKCTCSNSLTCKDQGKHPRVKWRSAATCDPAKIRRWWEKWPAANVAIACGTRSQLWVLDVDPAKGGEQTLDALIAANERLPTTMMVSTGGGGWHYLFAWPTDGRIIGNRVAIGPGLDARGEGGYVVAPPSNHISGGRYVNGTGVH